MIDVAILLPKLLCAGNDDPEFTETAAKLAWSRAAGPGLRRHAVAFRLYSKTLVVSVADAIWQKQLRAMSAEFVFRVNRLLGAEVVDLIEFRVDPATLSQLPGNVSRRNPVTQARSQPVPADLISAAESIGDEDLRQLFVRAAGNCIARRDARMGME